MSAPQAPGQIPADVSRQIPADVGRRLPAVWSRRRLLASLALGGLAAPTLSTLLAACGDPSTVPATDPTSTDPLSPASTTPDTQPAPTITHPTGSDAEVLRLYWEGGMMIPWMSQYPPTMLIAGDAVVFVPGAVDQIYPGPLLYPVYARAITEGGVQTILAMLRDEGLFVDPAPDYELPEGQYIADASTTVLRFTADGVTYTHRAYALGLGLDLDSDSTPDRARLLSVTQRLGDLPTLVGGLISTEEPIHPRAYRMYAWAVDPADFGSDIEPTIVPWPTATGVILAEVASIDMSEPACTIIAADRVGDLFATAHQLTFFEEDGVHYQLSVVVVLPGDDEC